MRLLDRIFKASKRDNLDRYYLVKLFGFGIFLHRIHHDEAKNVFHNHPWNWISIIFGSYSEERKGQPAVARRWLNWNKAPTHHRVELPNGPVWTLLFHGRRYNRWSVVDGDGKVISEEPWRGIGGRTSYTPEGYKENGM